MIGRFAVVALAAAIVLGGLAAGFALSDDDGAPDGRFGVIDLAKTEDDVTVTTIDDEAAPAGDGDDTADQDGTGGGDDTGDGDRSRDQDGTGGGNNGGPNSRDGDGTRGNDGTRGGATTAAAPAPARSPAPAPAAPAGGWSGGDSWSGGGSSG